ncbi:MAG: transcription-repair coupling factor [Chloroflexota bacterium]
MTTIFSVVEKNISDLRLRLAGSADKGIHGLASVHLALLLCLFDSPFFVVEDSAESAALLSRDVSFVRGMFPFLTAEPVMHFPTPSNPGAIGARALALREMARHDRVSIITSLDACRTGFDMNRIADEIMVLRKGFTVDRAELGEHLSGLGYRRVSVVADRGEYSERQWVFDVFPVTDDLPARIEFFGDEIDLIRIFDIETQMSTGERDQLVVPPAEEGEPAHDLIPGLLSRHEAVLFWAAKSEEMPQGDAWLQGSAPIAISHLPFAGRGIDSGALSLKGLGIAPEERKSLDDLAAAVRNLREAVVLVVPSHAQAERLREILRDGGVVAPIIGQEDVASYEGWLCVTVGALSTGLRMPGIVVLTDREIFGERPSYRPLKKSKVSSLLRTIDDLKPGDFVVHKDHGIGRFVAVERQRSNGREEDLIVLEYSQGDRLLIPFQGIDRLQKFSAGEGHSPHLDRLGGRSWQRTKQKVGKAIREMAERLLKLYAARKVARGFIFSADTPLHVEFDGFFPYEETPDQLRCIEDIERHMQSENPMDLLLCGDVGYGKTEVAMRAAFRAVYDGKQVAVLVPTTLLAEQHFRTFRTRFSGFPVTIDNLSRFRKKEEARRSLVALAKGETDIIIGTHMLLGKGVHFADLGLLIIDEEHRFGVAQKEKMKELKKGIDVITLTATPIPRTLHMSLSGIRELCTIETPPEERLAVRSIVTEYSDSVIREAIERELRRGGQAFFVHNRIGDIEKVGARLLRLIPAARLAIAHGQMREAHLEKIMLDFVGRKTDILVCTSIIGSGLDIPTANTIIVDRADHFGISDLYQLRGRVGRGSVQAYAYFLMPGEDLLTDDAKKRLRAIQEMSYLGAGFRLALKDLEIRGAGNLLGAEQSGHIYKVGFDMYLEMLERAVAELKGEETVEEVDPQIRLDVAAFIPETYVPDVTLRLSLYRRLSSARTLDALSGLKEELLDRFGRIPEEVENLFHVIKMRTLARQLYIEKVQGLQGRYRFSLVSDTEKRYGVPENFYDRFLKALFALQSSADAGRFGRIRFYPDGFELDAGGASARDAVPAAERMLEVLRESLREKGN